MGLFRVGGGSWYISSKTDPRWNFTQQEEALNIFEVEKLAKRKINELKKILGEPPKDLECGCMKD